MTDAPLPPRRRLPHTAAGSLEDLAGPFYDAAALQEWLGVSPQVLDFRVWRQNILALTTGDGTVVYPAWQWRADKSTVPHLGRLLPLLLAGSRDPWSAALWMTSPVDWGDGCAVPAWKWLDQHHDPTPVADQARADAARWGR